MLDIRYSDWRCYEEFKEIQGILEEKEVSLQHLYDENDTIFQKIEKLVKYAFPRSVFVGKEIIGEYKVTMKDVIHEEGYSQDKFLLLSRPNVSSLRRTYLKLNYETPQAGEIVFVVTVTELFYQDGRKEVRVSRHGPIPPCAELVFYDPRRRTSKN